MKSEEKVLINKIFNISYYCYMAIILIQSFLKQTVIDSTGLEVFFRYGTFLFACLVMFKVAYEFWNKWDERSIIVACLCIIPLMLCGMWLHQDYYLGYIMLIIGAKNMDIRKVFKLFLVITIVLTVFTVALCLSGNIENVITYRDASSTHQRMALGFNYATNLTSHILIIVAVWAFIRQKKIKYFELAIMCILGISCYIIAEARIAAFSIILIALFVLAYKVVENRSIVSDNITTFVGKISIILFPLLTIISIVLGLLYKYDSNIWSKLDSLSSERISQNAIALFRYPITMLGHTVTDIGTQVSGQHGISENYFTINNSFISVLIKMGVIGLVATAIVWVFICYKEHKEKNIITTIILMVMCFYFFFEHRIYEFSNNPFLLLLFSGMAFSKKKETMLKKIGLAIVIAFAFELVVFNIKPIITSMNEVISYADCGQGAPGVYMTDNDTLASNTKPIVIEAYNVPTIMGMNSVYMNLNVFDVEDKYRCMTDYSYSVDVYDISYEEPVYLKSFEIDVDNPKTFYSDILIDSFYQNVRFVLNIDEDCQFLIYDFEFNGRIPFDISLLRIIILAVVLFIGIILYDRLIKRSQSISNEET